MSGAWFDVYMKAFAKNLKTIYTAADEEAARKQLETVKERNLVLSYNQSFMEPILMNFWKSNTHLNCFWVFLIKTVKNLNLFRPWNW